MTTTATASSRSLGRSFRCVWWSVVVGSTGDGMFTTALPLLAATLTRDPLQIAGIAVAARLPWLLLSMVTGAIADRFDRRRLMVRADLVRFVVVGLLVAAIVTDRVGMWSLYACAFLLGAAETLHVNAAQALLPALVEPRHLMPANARLASAQVAAVQFAGPPLGVALFNTAAALPFVADAVSFAGSAALVRALPDAHRVPPPRTRLRDDIVEGLQFLVHHAVLRRITLLLATVNFVYFGAVSLLVLYSDDQLGGGDVAYTAMFVAGAAGTVVSRYIVARVCAVLGGAGTITLAMWTWGLTMAGLTFTDGSAVAVAMFFVLGVGNGLWLTLANTMRQQVTPDRLLGRMNAAFRTVSWGIVPFGAAFGGWAASNWGLQAPFGIAAAVMTAIALAARWVLAPARDALEQAARSAQ